MKRFAWTLFLGVSAFTLWPRLGQGGSLVPPGAPAPTMNSLSEVYQKLTNTLTEAQSANLKLTNAMAEIQIVKQKLTNTLAEVQDVSLKLTNTLAEVQAARLQITALEARLNADGMFLTSGDMVLIPAGSFVMGATTNAGHETISGAVPQHTVNISAFYIEKHEVNSNLWGEVYTWALARGYGFENPGLGKGGAHPVHTVNWHDCLKWCNARSQRDGFAPCYTNANGSVFTNGTFAGDCNWAANGYRLPTEAEWEKAARGGVASRRFPWDDANTVQHARANYFAQPSTYSYDTNPSSGNHPSYVTDPQPYTSPGGSFAPNGFGLYDMGGNVFEWCWDWYGNTYYGISSAKDPVGPASGSQRVKRGGAWTYLASDARCAARSQDLPGNKANYTGFRCARGL